MPFRTYEKVWAVLERKTNDQSEQRAISRVNLGVEESNFDSVEF